MKSLSSSFKITILLSLIFFSKTVVHAQTIPSFKIMQTNGKEINSMKLPNTRPVILIYFAPDCDHCTTLLNSLFKEYNEFVKATIVLVSFKPLNEVIAFEKNYHTTKYKNMIVGVEEPTFFLKNFYNLESTPFTALFDKKGKLVYSYKKETPLNDLALRLKNIK
jgi:peroxiredoxin